jgi:predicted double-glycine peptidase
MKHTLHIVTAAVLAGALNFAPAGFAVDLSWNKHAMSVPVKSYQEMLFGDVWRQQFDFSCGSAALATLLQYHYQHPIEEHTIFTAMYANGDKALIKEQGFSLLDMKNYLEQLGYSSDGYKVELDKLAQLGVPGITLVNFDGYMHFVVIKGMNDKKIILGDPSRGTIVLYKQDFMKAYQGITLLIKSKVPEAKETFITDENYSVYTESPNEHAISRQNLGDMFLHVSSSYY